MGDGDCNDTSSSFSRAQRAEAKVQSPNSISFVVDVIGIWKEQEKRLGVLDSGFTRVSISAT